MSPVLPGWPRTSIRNHSSLALALLLAIALAACGSTVQESLGTDDIPAVTVVSEVHYGTELAGQAVSGTIVVTTEPKGWIKSVRYHLDGVEIGHVRSEPFSVTIDTTTLSIGQHTLRVEPLAANGRSRSEYTASFTVSNPAVKREAYSLRGDPHFSPENLSTAHRAHYDRLWAEIVGYRSEWLSEALSDDIFVYARSLASHVQAVLIVFRITGDLALLDYVDTIGQAMRSKLADGWRGTNDGTNGTRDGYRNWVFRPGVGGTDQHVGKDTRQIDEVGAHANVAAIAYALEANRDLSSPTGRDYAAHADFWKDYLVNHFEAKWRERTGEMSGFPIMTHASTGTFFKWLRWHYYMGQLTGDSAYSIEATRMADIFWDHMYEIDTPSGTAYVWAATIAALDDSRSDVLNATTYAGHFYGHSVEFHLEGFHHWASNENMRRLARTFTEFIIDTDDPIKNGMASDIGGAEKRLHLKPDTGRTRLGLSQYRDRNYAFIAAWDATGKITRLTTEVQNANADRDRDTSRLLAAEVVTALMDFESTATAGMTEP